MDAIKSLLEINEQQEGTQVPVSCSFQDPPEAQYVAGGTATFPKSILVDP